MCLKPPTRLSRFTLGISILLKNGMQSIFMPEMVLAENSEVSRCPRDQLPQFFWSLSSVIWGLSKIMVPENCPYAALSRTFRTLSRPSRIGTWDYDKVFVCKFVTTIYRRIVFKNVTYWRSVFKAALVTFLLCVMSLFLSTELMALGKSAFLWGRLTSGHWFCTHSLKSFWSCDIVEKLAHFGPQLGPGGFAFRKSFRGPFVNLSWFFSSNN
jgi:hypothetical protein